MDLTYLIAISEGDKDFTDQFISTFQNSTEKILISMRTALKQNDFDLLRKSVHQLKPSLEMLHLKSHQVAVKIHEDPTSAAFEDIQEIEAECQNAVQFMQAEFA